MFARFFTTRNDLTYLSKSGITLHFINFSFWVRLMGGQFSLNFLLDFLSLCFVFFAERGKSHTQQITTDAAILVAKKLT